MDHQAFYRIKKHLKNNKKKVSNDDDFELFDSGKGEGIVIKKWNEQKLGPKPNISDLMSLDVSDELNKVVLNNFIPVVDSLDLVDEPKQGNYVFLNSKLARERKIHVYHNDQWVK